MSGRSGRGACKIYTPEAAAALQRRYADFRMKPTYKGPLAVPDKLSRSRSMSNSRRSGTRRHHRPKTYGGDGEYDTWAAEGYTQKMFDDATIVKQIGTGAFGKVFTIRLPDERIIVRKDVNYGTADRCKFAKMIKNEAQALKELSETAHLREHISPLVGYKLQKHSEDDIEYGPFTSSFYMEFMNGMELFDYINKFYEERKALDYSFIQSIHNRVEWILRNIHAKGWFHRDISPENIFMILDSGGNLVRPVVIDFGLACRNEGEECLLPVAGKVPYMNDEYKRAPRNARGRVLYKAAYDFSSLNKTTTAWTQINDHIRATLAVVPVAAAAAAAEAPAADHVAIEIPVTPQKPAGLRIGVPGAPKKPTGGGQTRRRRHRA